MGCGFVHVHYIGKDMNERRNGHNITTASNMWEVCEQAMEDYIKSGAADKLLLERLAAIEDQRPRCDRCRWWDGKTMYCLLPDAESGNAMPFYSCDNFCRREKN